MHTSHNSPHSHMNYVIKNDMNNTNKIKSNSYDGGEKERKRRCVGVDVDEGDKVRKEG